MSFDSSTGESNHKEMKRPARQTQRNTKTFEQQTSGRLSENLLLDRAFRQIQPLPIISPNSNCHFLRGASYYVTANGMFVNNQGSAKSPCPASWPDRTLMDRITQLITTCIIPHLQAEARVQLYTTYKLSEYDKLIYRADPSYGNQAQAWHDWAMIDWDWEDDNPQELAKIPGRLCIFFEIPPSCTITQPMEVDEYCIIAQPGAYVILQSLVESPDVDTPDPRLWSKMVQESYSSSPLPNYLAHNASSLINWSCLEMEAEHPLLPKLRVFNVKSICSPTVAVPYDLNKFEKGLDQEQWLIIAPICQWKDKFLEEMPLFLNKEDRKKKK
jgi:hypothetical protein